MTNYPYSPGDYLAICDFCGFKRLRSEMKMTWENWLVCRDTCWEPRHPQDITPPSFVDRQWVEEPRDRVSINNFSGWFIQDATGSINKIGDEYNAFFQVDGSWSSANQVYAYADYGADYFDGDLEIRLILKWYDVLGVNTRNWIHIADGIAGFDDVDTVGSLGILTYKTPGGDIYLEIREGNNGGTWFTTITDLPPLLGKSIGLVLKRVGNNLELSIYEDQFFRKFIKTQTHALQGLTNLKYRYLFSCNASIVFEGLINSDIQFTQVELR